jgi:hypothetical protein
MAASCCTVDRALQCTFSVYVQRWLLFTLLFFVANICTACFGLSGHLQVYKLVLQGESYKATATAAGNLQVGSVLLPAVV